MKKQIQIGNCTIGENFSPFIIAEMSGNHNQSLNKALEIVEAAAFAGVDAIKLQTYTADTITLKKSIQINDLNSLWNGKNLHDLYTEAHTPWEWHSKIFKFAKSKGLLAFSSPFDVTAVDFLETLNVPVYKIASFENTDQILLKKVAKTGKPIIISSGASNLSDIDESIRFLRSFGCNDIILLKCTSNYPASPENSNINAIPYMREIFNINVGISDHTMGIGVPIAATALGARVIEKHLTIKRSEGGVDSAFSLEPLEFKNLVEEVKKAFLSLGNKSIEIQPSEQKSLFFKRSLYFIKNLNKGDIISNEDIKSFRPALGIATKYYDEIIGKVAKKDIKEGTPVSWDLI